MILTDNFENLPTNVQKEIKDKVNEFNDGTGIIYGIVGATIEIPRLNGGSLTLKLKPLDCDPNFEITYCEEKDVLFIKNMKCWPLPELKPMCLWMKTKRAVKRLYDKI